MKVPHPTKGTFDTDTATWQATYRHDGTEGDLDIGTSPDAALTAIRHRHHVHDPSTYLVFNSREWASFAEGIHAGEFDDNALRAARDNTPRTTSDA